MFIKLQCRKGEGQLLKNDPKGMHVGRRNFIKTTTMAGMAATLPGTALLGQDTGGVLKSRPDGMKKKLLCLRDSPSTHQKFIESIGSSKEFELLVNPVTVNYQKPQEVIDAIQGKDADILLLCLPRFTFSFGKLYDSLGDLGIPIIIFAQSPDMVLIDGNFAASLRTNGANVLFAISQEQAMEMLKAVASPRILEGKKAIIYGRPFDSTSVPAHNLNEDYVYKRTGVRIKYRPMEELIELFKLTDEASARKEAERWKKEAAKVVEPSDKTILDACRLYVLLRSIIEKEGLSAVSIDCLGLLFSPNPPLPYPCLSFARLRDEGITAACEADVCGLLSSMFLQDITRKPSFLSNVLSVYPQKSSVLFSHCVTPLKMMGTNASPLTYKLRDYHGMGRGVVPEVEFPVGIEIIAGSFTKDLNKFVLWPGRIQAGSREEPAKPSFPGGFRRTACANNAEVKIRDFDRFLQNIPGIHYIVIAGSYSRAMNDALLAMNVSMVGPSDFAAP
jgi:hypothetical protein